MIKTISIKSLKSIKTARIELGKLTIFTGLNNSGKSSAIQALRMLYEAAENKTPYLDGFGSFNDIKSSLTIPKENVKVEINHTQKIKSKLEINSLGAKIKISRDFPKMQYISADRFGPRVSLPQIRDDNSELIVGAFGQFSAHYAHIFENSIVPDKLRHSGSSSNTLKHQLISWMGEISPGVKLDFNVDKRYDTSSLTVDGNRSTNSGFGISYALPIILCLLTMNSSIGKDDSNKVLLQWFEAAKKNGKILLIENPEAHLHPRGQTSMGRLIALAASTGLQIIVETHSDHLLDGIRLEVKRNSTLNGKDVHIKFFAKDDKNGTTIDEISVMNNGKLDRWPQGFFDQFSINLYELS